MGEKRPLVNYIRLEPVGTAFLPAQWPRVLLIDEIDKCDINLSNDLLDLFEEGRYEIPELVRWEQPEVRVRADRSFILSLGDIEYAQVETGEAQNMPLGPTILQNLT